MRYQPVLNKTFAARHHHHPPTNEVLQTTKITKLGRLSLPRFLQKVHKKINSYSTVLRNDLRQLE